MVSCEATASSRGLSLLFFAISSSGYFVWNLWRALLLEKEKLFSNITHAAEFRIAQMSSPSIVVILFQLCDQLQTLPDLRTFRLTQF
jgi:hypothetical protein